MSTPGLLTITATAETLNGITNTAQSATVYIGKTIPSQTVIWRGYHIITNPVNLPALPNGASIYIDVPWLGQSNLTDGLSYMNRLPIPIDIDENAGNTTVGTPPTSHSTFKDEMTMPLNLNQDIPQQFTMKVYNRDGSPVSTSWVKFVQLQFSYGANTVSGF